MADLSYEERNKATYVPPPPTEVTIRTLESDVKSTALSGGNFPQSQRVSLPNREAPVKGGGGSRPMSSIWGKIFWLLAAFLVLGAVAYFVYPLVGSHKKTEPINSSSTAEPTLPSVPPHLTILKFDHQSFFRRTADRVLQLSLIYPVRTATDLQTYDQKILNLLTGDSSTLSLIEIEMVKSSGQSMALSEFLVAAGIDILPEDFLATNFNPDFTYFVYKNKNGFWPGFVVQLRPEKNPVVLKPEISNLEKSPKLEKIFITEPGNSAGSFEDILVSSQPARSLRFLNSTANFVYGWFHNYLVMSTSLEGLKEAVGRL